MKFYLFQKKYEEKRIPITFSNIDIIVIYKLIYSA